MANPIHSHVKVPCCEDVLVGLFHVILKHSVSNPGKGFGERLGQWG